MADVPQGGDQRVLDAGNPSILPFPKPNKTTTEVKTQPLAAQGSETDHQAWNKLIGMRTEQHDPALIQQQPMLVAGMVTSGIEDHVHQHLATHLPKVIQWVGAKTAVADITGGVAAIQASALNASDPVIRQDQLQFAKNLQALPAPEQQLLISYLSNPKELLTSTQQTSLSKALTATVPELQRQLLGKLLS